MYLYSLTKKIAVNYTQKKFNLFCVDTKNDHDYRNKQTNRDLEQKICIQKEFDLNCTEDAGQIPFYTEISIPL